MLRRSALTALFGITLLGRSVAAQESARPNPAKSTFLVIYKPGPNWLPGKPLAEQPLKEHGRYILSLYSKGKLKMGGPFADGTGGAAVLFADDENAARDMLAKDPAVASGVFVYELHSWGLVDWDSQVKK